MDANWEKYVDKSQGYPNKNIHSSTSSSQEAVAVILE